MNKISVIIKREYVTRVRKKSFIIMTLLAPILMGAIIILPTVFMATEKQEFKKIAIIEDGSDLFKNLNFDTDEVDYSYLENTSFEDLKKGFEEAGYYGILYISKHIINTPQAVQLISNQQPPLTLKTHIESVLEKEIERQKLVSRNIENLDEILADIRTNVVVETRKLDETGTLTKTSTEISMALAYLGGFLMYMLVFIFGAQVMRGVIEEKTSRVVEVIVSSVKPVQLMMGKIIGIALVGLTQFMMWVILTAAIAITVSNTLLKDKSAADITQNLPQNVMDGVSPADISQPSSQQMSAQMEDFAKLFDNIMNQNWLLIIPAFIFYFLTGYLLYASIFAAIGSAVDNETESQQFMLPVTIPIILALMVAMGTMQNPESSLAFWFSLIPLTSPIVMMARIPFDPPAWQIVLSMVLMLATFWAFVWMAAKIYRTGILMYGKKSSWKELWKWLRYKG